MLNLLIALMGDIFGEVQDNAENEWLLERLNILLEIESLLPDAYKGNDMFPTYLHVLEPKVDELKEEHAELKLLHSIVEQNQNYQSQSNKQHEELSTKVREMSNNLRSIEQAYDVMKNMRQQLSMHLQSSSNNNNNNNNNNNIGAALTVNTANNGSGNGNSTEDVVSSSPRMRSPASRGVASMIPRD